MASVRQIAKQAGVSTATVSRVMNNSPLVSETARQKVMRAIDDSRYTPVVGKKSSSNIAYLFTDSVTLASPYDAGVLGGLSAGMEQQQLDLLILSARTCCEPGESFGQMFRRKGVRGAIVRTTASTREVCQAILESGIPVVVLGDQIEGYESVCVDVNSREASHEAVEHLIGLGHERIAFCTNVIDDKDHQDRLEGYRRALTEGGIACDRKLMFRVPASRQGGEQLARRLATMVERPTALYVADPSTCVGLMSEARRLKISVPGDLSVVGFDDSEIRYTTAPELTSVCQNTELLGRNALTCLAGRMSPEQEGIEAPQKLLAWFEVNGTTGPARVAPSA